MRKCHLNTCPVGVATQNPELRKKFTGDPDHVVNYFKFLAEDLREIMAELGVRTIDEMVGQADALKLKEKIDPALIGHLNLEALLYKAEPASIDGSYQQIEQDHEMWLAKDWEILKKVENSLESGMPTFAEFDLVNTDRAVGAILSNEISKKYKGDGLPKGTINLKFKGSAGQSFGAFAAPGIKFEVEGEANDYFGKGLSGADLVIYPHKESKFVAESNQIIGNVAFYGGTAGEAYIRGQAGERFCVRNSGVKAVVEGIGDHGCEYMTGGVVVILGQTGRNFAAGMSGGVAYVYDSDSTFSSRCNHELVELDPLSAIDLEELKELIQNHAEYTSSATAISMLENWQEAQIRFIKVMPRDYKLALQKKNLQTA
jgi:glutamate synthase (NADPH/NADH) large chain